MSPNNIPGDLDFSNHMRLMLVDHDFDKNIDGRNVGDE